jgi:hypothetical protein
VLKIKGAKLAICGPIIANLAPLILPAPQFMIHVENSAICRPQTTEYSTIKSAVVVPYANRWQR